MQSLEVGYGQTRRWYTCKHNEQALAITLLTMTAGSQSESHTLSWE